MGRALELLVFDWDGTLIDSAASIVACIQAAVAELGWEPRSDHQVRDIIGLGWMEACRVLYPDSLDAEFEQLRGAYQHYYFDQLRQPAALFAGAEQVLATLQEQGYWLAVATGKGRAGLDRALAQTGLGKYLVTSRCADETTSKPHPQMLLEIMAELAVAPARTVMIGDTEYDLAMARNAGTHAIAAAYGVHEPARLLAYNPLASLAALTELPAILETL
jgi:phosphoglycolate phosphatase